MGLTGSGDSLESLPTQGLATGILLLDFEADPLTRVGFLFYGVMAVFRRSERKSGETRREA